MQELCRYIEAHCDETLPLKDLAAQTGLSAFHLQRRFKAAIGVTPKDYQESCRLKSLKSGLKKKASVTTAIYDAGYKSSSRVYGKTDKSLGMTPRQYKRRGEALEISYASAPTPLGRLMIAATDRGICFIQFGATDKELHTLLAEEFPAAALAPMNAAQQDAFAKWMQSLSAYLKGDNPRLDLPLDIRGTAFQMKVWKYLQKIPAGEAQSYTAVAKGIGQPTAARAVASACAANKIAIAIPCHRVIRGDGSLSGYKWGTPRKEQLLALEGRAE